MAFDRASVKGLPEGANVQVIKDVPYVYFRYQWKDATGKVKYARDYLGTVENGGMRVRKMDLIAGPS